MTARASHGRYLVDGAASPAATQRLFGIDDERAATLARWVDEALRSSDPEPVVKTPRLRARKAR